MIRRLCMTWVLLVSSLLPAASAAPVEWSLDELLRQEELSAPDAQQRAEKRDEAIQFVRELTSTRCETSVERFADMLYRLAFLLEERALFEQRPDDREAAVALLTSHWADDFQASRVDEWLYLEGVAVSRLPDPAGQAVLRQMVDEHPLSEQVPMALLHLSELAASQGQLEVSLRALEDGSWRASEVGDLALYKLAWALHRDGQQQRALDLMLVAVSEARPSLDPIAREAVLYWAEELGQSDEVSAALAALDPNTGTCLDQLDERRQRIAAQRESVVAMYEQLAIVACLRQEGTEADVERELTELRRSFGKGSRWYDQQDRPTRRRARQAVRAAR